MHESNEVGLVGMLEDINARLSSIRQTLHAAQYRLNGPRPEPINSAGEARKSPDSVREWVRELLGQADGLGKIAAEIDNAIGFSSTSQIKATGTSPTRY